MKDFINTFFAVIVSSFIFVFLGGYILFDFSRNFYLALIFCSLIASVIIYVLFKLTIRIEALEQKIEAIESSKIPEKTEQE